MGVKQDDTDQVDGKRVDARRIDVKRIEKWVWILIYLGMFLVAVGLASHAGDPALGWLLGWAGAAAIVAGIALIWLRSLLKNAEAPR
jgi:hypothetical protein